MPGEDFGVMGVKVTKDNTREVLERAASVAFGKAVGFLRYVGDSAVSLAFQQGDYRDITGNLRSSVGYVISNNGSVIGDGGFWNISQDGTGARVGYAKASEMASQLPGLALVMVAGMKYASLVSDRGYDVLDSAQILAERLIREAK